MEDNIKPASFGRYSEAKYNRFKKWMDTPHGQNVYRMFRKFSHDYRNAGHEHGGANCVGNRVRWEVSVGEYKGFKISNDFLPMLGRQLVIDDTSFEGFFRFHADKENNPGTDPEHDPEAVETTTSEPSHEVYENHYLCALTTGIDPEHDYDDNA
jgi:hypothetical protein